MKKLKLFVVGMLTMGLSISVVNAAEVKNAAQLNACLTAFDECKFTADIVEDGETVGEDLDGLDIYKDVVIDLNGHTLTLKENVNEDPSEVVGAEIEITTGNVVIKNGTIVQESSGNIAAINVYSDASLKTENLTINVTGNITTGKKGKEQIPRAIVLTGMDGKQTADLDVSSDTIINVTNGYGLAISSGAHVTLNGTWNTGRSLVANNNGATKNSFITFESGVYNAKNGAVIPITRGNWIFNGGTFTSVNDDTVHIYKPVNGQGVAKPDALTVKINGGLFETKSNAHKSIHSEELKNFVYGGAFKATKVEWEVLTDYLANTVKTYVDNGVTYVGLESPVTVTAPTNGKVTANKENAITGQTVTVTLEPDDGYVSTEITLVDEEGKAVEYKKTGNVLTFVMPASEVTITVAFEEKADYTALDEALAKAIEIDPTSYTDESYAALAAAIEKAYALDGGLSKAHQDEIDVITEEINNALAGLKEVTAESGNPENPNTLDSLPLYLVGGAVAVLGVAGLGYSIKKKFEN